MTDERIDALIRRLDIPSDPNPMFVDRTYESLLPHLARAQRRDARAVGRWWAGLWPLTSPDRSTPGRAMRPALTFAVLVMLIVGLLFAVAMSGALRRPSFGANGPLLVAHGGDLLMINTETSEVKPVLRETTPLIGLTRSPDSRSVAFWTGPGTGSQLWMSNVDGSDRRQIAPELKIARGGCIGDWAPDSKAIASEVIDRGVSRILVTDAAGGRVSFATPPGVIAHCPMWSPDGRTIAFEHDDAAGHSALAVVGPDATGMRDVSGDLDGVEEWGANGWSPDSSSIFFGAGGDGLASVYRADVRTATSTRLTRLEIQAYAPTVSPDGALVTFIVWTGGWWDLYLIRSDGTGEEQPLLEHATNNGWSSDGKYVLAQWHEASPGAANGGLTLVTPDGKVKRVVLPFDWVCPLTPDNDQPECLDGAGWGEPTP